MQAGDFDSYSILCFNAEDERLLNVGAFLAQDNTNVSTKPRIKYIPGCERFVGGDIEVEYKDPKILDELVTAVRLAIDKFFVDEFGTWYQQFKVPDDERYRTLQFEMDMYDFPGDPEIPLNDIPQFKEWEKVSGCSIKITKNRLPNNEITSDPCTISVIGPAGSNIGDTATGEKSLLEKVEDAFRGIATTPLQVS